MVVQLCARHAEVWKHTIQLKVSGVNCLDTFMSAEHFALRVFRIVMWALSGSAPPNPPRPVPGNARGRLVRHLESRFR